MSAKRLLAFAILSTVLALLTAGRAFAIGEDEFLDPADAFKYTATADVSTVTVEWHATKGYYLYKKRMGIAAATPGVTVGEPVYPKGEVHKDEYFGEQEVFRNDFKVTAPLQGAKPGDTIALKLKWQGCADAGLCYPPSTWDATVKVAGAAAAAAPSKTDEVFGANKAKSPIVEGEDEFLPVDGAFALTADAASKNVIKLNWRIADGYYLYKNRIKLVSGDDQPIGGIELPKGEPHSDEYFGDQEIYRQSLDATFSVPNRPSNSVSIKVTYQGCADAGLCYPPETKTLSVSLENAPATAAVTPTGGATQGSGYVSEQDSFTARLTTGSLWLVFAICFAGGLLMAFTPCVLPMVPILSGIIAGGGPNMSSTRAFFLSLSYVGGIAVIYVLMGVLVALVGHGVNLQAIFNQTWILVPFALLFVVLATSMFGAFTIEMPSFIQSKLSDASNQQRAGTFIGVGVMGALSALIVSACVAPVLIGALSFIAQGGSVARGAIAMFAIALGMGTPLLLVGTSAGALLPRAGAWMETIKNLFGVAFLFVAAWLLNRVVLGWASMLLWAVPAFALAWVLWKVHTKSAGKRYAWRGVAVAFALYGVSLVVGGALGSTNPFAPIPALAAKVDFLEFKRIKTLADLEREVAAAKASGKSVMLDFYADWCVSCKEMEHKTFTIPDVQAALANTVKLQADVTANDDEDQALLKHFDIFGPPTIAFYGTDGEEKRNFRVVGFMEAAEFAAVVRQAVDAPKTP
ncbi:MAG TPA: protein-disulfide reductase DsbD [Steroidobacteraceae bacterium]|nr:protein-disulfide reductase DsbD [Steroidobacteraceae bacterium]